MAAVVDAPDGDKVAAPTPVEAIEEAAEEETAEEEATPTSTSTATSTSTSASASTIQVLLPVHQRNFNFIIYYKKGPFGPFYIS